MRFFLKFFLLDHRESCAVEDGIEIWVIGSSPSSGDVIAKMLRNMLSIFYDSCRAQV